MRALAILVLPGESQVDHELVATAQRLGASVALARTAEEWLRSAEESSDAALVQGRWQSRQQPVFVLADTGSETLAVAALRNGACDYLTVPVSTAAQGNRAMRLINSSACRAIAQDSLVDGGILVGQSATMRHIKDEIRDIADSDSNVLITGETVEDVFNLGWNRQPLVNVIGFLQYITCPGFPSRFDL